MVIVARASFQGEGFDVSAGTPASRSARCTRSTMGVYLSITMSRRVQTAVNQWCNEERQALETQLRDLANADARMQIERWKQQHEQEIRLDAVQRSSAVTRGKVTEHIVPYLPGFDLNPKDIRFLGTPIDLIAFKGRSDLWKRLRSFSLMSKQADQSSSRAKEPLRKL